MKENRTQGMTGYPVRHRRRGIKKTARSVLAGMVALSTVYSMILPAAALQEDACCGIEAHEHGQDCYTRVLICGQEEGEKPQEGESGTPQERVLICTLEEKESAIHEHSEACRTQERVLICAQEESADVHTHTESCAATEQRLVCTDESEGHVHGEECYEQAVTYVCGMEEGAPAGHVHTDACYITEEKLSCGLEEGAEIPGHTHTDACYAAEETPDTESAEGAADADPTATGEEEAGHTHSEACYTSTLTCEKKEHRHELMCFSNPEADVENEEVWARSVAGVTLTGRWADDLAAIAQSQIGYAESTRNYSVDEHGEVKGYSRYGAWYGNAYGDWCAMFVSFCLHYAGIPEEAFPYQSACGRWVETLQAEEYGLWREKGAYTPEKGDVIFFDTDGDGEADHTGIIAETGFDADGQWEKIISIEGNYGDRVQYVEHSAGEESIAGFAALPENPEKEEEKAPAADGAEAVRAALTETGKTVTVSGADGAEATAASWTPGTENEVEKKLSNALVMVGQGYTIRSAEYYEISGLTGSRATVTYSGGGLSAGNAEEVFVYDLGTDGTALVRCDVTESARDEGTGTFSSFSFDIPTGGDGTAHVYAFISASHATLEEMGIYLGEEQGNGTWVACDAATEADANVRVTITMPDDAEPPAGYRPFIRKIREGEGFYPKNEAVLAEAGANNGWQCYTIRWITQRDDGTLHMIPLNLETESSAGVTVQVGIEYLNEAAQLSGPAGGRKLLIFNSTHEGALKDQVADLVENVLVNDSGYTSFTFHASHSGPYVFVSKRLERGYIDALAIESIIDGSAPFDSSDTAGCDSGANNRIIRSYDTIQYNLAATFAAREEGITQETVDMYFELTLNKSSTAARFDVSKMVWLGENYSIEYLNGESEVIMVLARDGKFYRPLRDESGEVRRDVHGFALPDTNKGKISINAGVNGSDAGPNSYRVASGGVATQRLVGCTTLKANKGESILSGTQKFPLAVEVRNADHGEVFAPQFKMWLEGNEENYGPETRGADGAMSPATPDTGNVLDIGETGNEQYRVTVSAGTNFNLQLKKNTDMSYKNWFDFSTGEAVAESDRAELERLAKLEENHGRANPAEFTDNGAELSEETKARYANFRYGRMTCYGITLQLYNNTDNNPEANRAAKGLKGLSLPVGAITFDLNFSSEVKSHEVSDPDQYTAILWDYNENIPANYSYTFHYDDPGRETVSIPATEHGNGGRRLYWDGETRSPYAKGGAPSNYRGYHDGCYYGGDWTLLDDIDAVASPKAVTGSGAGTSYHFSVSDYDFDFDGQHFPTKDAGNSGTVTGYDSYARCFSAGCVQVLSVFPRVQKISEAELFLNATVSNLKLETRAGQKLAPQTVDSSGYAHEVNRNDNVKRDQIVLYAPGSLTKGSSFNGKSREHDPKTTTDGFLGTDYWSTSYDCSTFAGDEIWIMSYGMIGSGSDFRTRSMNLLQLFDSRALSIYPHSGQSGPKLYQDYDPLHDEPGTTRFLYAADPDCPDGYDTNIDGVLAYMNTVREEDLRYFTTLEELKGAGFTCVGVLMELRGCDLLGGKYQYMSIPVKVNGDDKTLVGKTVATVNTFRVWSTDQGEISWGNGVWNETLGKNELENYSKPTNTVEDGAYSAELANSTIKSPPPYVKTEYQEGLQRPGTHAGGTLSGNSLLILSYEAAIRIGVDNKGESSKISYNLGDGETVVDYRLKNIRTNISDLTGQTENPTTTLTVKAVLDEGHTGEQRIFVAGGSFGMEGYAVAADGKAADTISSIAIGSDPNNPTELEYDDADGVRQRIRVYAQMGGNNQSVTFVIQDAPVGLELPDITFQANFAAMTALQNNDTITTGAYISGQGDNRAYDKAKGNTDNITVSIIMLGGTNLTKAVDTRYIELNGEITYTVTYTNSGTDTVGKIYFYDLLPKTGDIRGSDYDGSVVLGEVGVESSKEVGAAPAGATVYYSTTEYRELYDRVKLFEGGANDTSKAEENIELLIAGGVADSRGQPFFSLLGEVKDGSFRFDDAYSALTAEEKSKITGLYVKAEELQKGQTIKVTIPVQTSGNMADDWYKNIANSWIAGSATAALTSNKVETQVVSRSISGLVWHDKNLNGVRDAGEALLDGVTATLFKRDGGTYKKCERDVTGETIAPVTSAADGAYRFDRLAEGDYIVAFSGKTLEKFTGAADYQARGRNDADTNDGKAIGQLKPAGIDEGEYPYFICFSQSAESVRMHSLDEMSGGSVRLVNGVESYTNQDLGLVTEKFELGETGGTGTAPYTAAGLLMMGAAVLRLFRSTKRKEGKA